MVKVEAWSVRFWPVHICGECDLHLLTLQHTATHTQTPDSQETVGREAYTLQHTATPYNKPRHTRRPQIVRRQMSKRATRRGLFAAATHCNTLQHTATHSQETDVKEGYKKRPLCRMTKRSLNILLRNTLQQTTTDCITLQHTVAHCNTM